jgi:peptidoglycan L-alanyl-D-glutamate endopeptidase CwlK
MALFSVFDDMGESEIPSCVRIYDSLHPELKFVIDDVARHFDIALIEGYRGPERQAELVEGNLSRKDFPKSKHNIMPSQAVDLLPYPINRENHLQIAYLAGHMRMAGKCAGVKIVWGGDTKQQMLVSGRFKNISYVHHFELVL